LNKLPAIKVMIIAAILALIWPNILLADDFSACLDCHDGQDKTLIGSPHELSSSSHLKSSIKIGCGDCHTGWKAHLDDPSSKNIGIATNLSAAKQAELCSKCHLTPHQAAMISTDPHSRTELACTSCHTIHSNPNNSLVKEDLDNYCLSCHTATAFEFKKRSVHPLESGNVRCVDCHNLGSMKDPLLAVGFNGTCQKCHAEESGPFLYEHPVVYNHLVNGGGCTECHEPHGSEVDRLLKQPGSGICLQCHGTPVGHFTEHSGLGSKLYCVQCHTEIHGSFNNRLFLDPDLGIKLFPDCYQSGCHALAN
jgi:DmsE family decaheme c-type cytochrome